MQLETIVRAAIHDIRAGRLQAHCGELPSGITDAEPLAEITWAEGYAEPGYTDPPKGILFANWNNYPSKLTDVLERAGYGIEWSDEWSTCDGCGKAIRTSPNSYSWEMAGRVDEGGIYCNDCVDWAEVLEQAEDDPTTAIPSDVDPAEFGYERLSDAREYESGFHPGQTDDPAKILAALQAQGYTRVIFRIARVQQFDVHFETWQRIAEDVDGIEDE